MNHHAKLARRMQEALASDDLQPFAGFAPGAGHDDIIRTLGESFDSYVYHSVVQEVAFKRYLDIETASRSRLPIATGYILSCPPYHVGLDRHGELHVGHSVKQVRRSMERTDEHKDTDLAKLVRRIMGGTRPPGRDG